MPIKEGKPASYQKLVWKTNSLSQPIEVPNTDYLIIEGISSYHPDIAEFMDYKIWIEAPSDIAMARGSKRDRELGANNDQLWQHWTTTYQEYKDQYKPEQKADFIYDGSGLMSS